VIRTLDLGFSLLVHCQGNPVHNSRTSKDPAMKIKVKVEGCKHKEGMGELVNKEKIIEKIWPTPMPLP